MAAARPAIRAGYEYIGPVGDELLVKDPMTTGRSPLSAATLAVIHRF